MEGASSESVRGPIPVQRDQVNHLLFHGQRTWRLMLINVHHICVSFWGKKVTSLLRPNITHQDHKSRDLFVNDWGKTNDKTIFYFREMVLRRHQERLVSHVVGQRRRRSHSQWKRKWIWCSWCCSLLVSLRAWANYMYLTLSSKYTHQETIINLSFVKERWV